MFWNVLKCSSLISSSENSYKTEDRKLYQSPVMEGRFIRNMLTLALYFPESFHIWCQCKIHGGEESYPCFWSCRWAPEKGRACAYSIWRLWTESDSHILGWSRHYHFLALSGPFHQHLPGLNFLRAFHSWMSWRSMQISQSQDSSAERLEARNADFWIFVLEESVRSYKIIEVYKCIKVSIERSSNCKTLC
jgi:hypothetical protein